MNKNIKSVKAFVLSHYPDAKIMRVKGDSSNPQGKYLWAVKTVNKLPMGLSHISIFDSWFKTAIDIVRHEEINKFLTPERQRELLDLIK